MPTPLVSALVSHSRSHLALLASFGWSMCGMSALHGAFVSAGQTAGINSVLPPAQEVPFPAGIDPSTIGYAICVTDLNRDGWSDVIVSQNPRRCLVFMNQKDGTFREEGDARGLAQAIDISGIAAGDLQNRGLTDLVMLPRNGDRYLVYVNSGDGTFVERAVERGAASVVSGQTHRGQSIALVDYDRDGFLDIHATEYGVQSTAQDSLYSVLLHNRGNSAPGFFENTTVVSGLKQPHFGSQAYGFASGWADFDEDGWPDLYLTSDYGTSQLWWNNGNGTFTEGREAARVGHEGNGMGLAIADVNRDGRLDVFVSSFDSLAGGLRSANRLYLNEGGRKFRDEAFNYQVTDTSWGWGAAFLDANNDGRQDLMVTNGAKYFSPFGQSAGDGLIKNANLDPTQFFLGGDAGFNNATALWGVTDTAIGRGLAVLDYNNDGFEDVLISNSYDQWVLYRNTASDANRWVRFRFRGTSSNRDGYGARVTVTAGGKTQVGLYAPTNAYIGQREPFLHFGLDQAAVVDRITVLWPSGVEQVLENLAINHLHDLVEPVNTLARAPSFSEEPRGGTFPYASELTLTARVDGYPAPTYTWYKDGVAIPGQARDTLNLGSLHAYDVGEYKVVATNGAGTASSATVRLDLSVDLNSHSIARWWNEELIDAIRRDTPNPPVHARNLYHLSSALWDAFWAYERSSKGNAESLFQREEPTLPDDETLRQQAQAEAMSHAAFRVLAKRYAASPGAARTLSDLRWLMGQFGFSPDDTSTKGQSPAAVGNRIGAQVLSATLFDGANEPGGYADKTGYVAVNAPLVPGLPGTLMVDPNRWQPLALTFSITQNGIVQAGGPQPFVGVNARLTTPFALAKPTATTLSLDPGPPPQLGGVESTSVVDEIVEVIRKSSELDPTQGRTLNISPGAMLNNRLGRNDGRGHALNPATGRPYADNVVNLGDYSRVLAEFWADGPHSETPPGHWNVLFNEVSDHPDTTRRLSGSGPVLPRLEWDVRGYLALNGALHDAACAAWTVKRQYDGVRPISLVRHLSALGQSSDPNGIRYHPQGLPLVPDLIEQVSRASLAPGQRHASLVQRERSVDSLIGKIAIRSWRGIPDDSSSQIGGVGWVWAEDWVPYQRNTFVTPAFPGYISGHSTFSRTAAEVLTLLTGSPYFPGGYSSKTFFKDRYLLFEKGPSADLTLQWATYYDAADQAGVSRLYGGIHVSVDDVTGRRLGSRIGLEAYLKATALRHGSTQNGELVNLSTRARTGGGDKTLIMGFVMEGEPTEPTLVRAIGPSLQAFGLPITILAPDPSLQVFGAQGASDLVAFNDQWGQERDRAALATLTSKRGAFALPNASLDAACAVPPQTGAFTVVTAPGGDGQAKVALLEVYGQKLRNGSARGWVGREAESLVIGFSLAGTEPVPVLVRGIGPGLAAFGLSSTASDPELRVHRLPGGGAAPELVAVNDDWAEDPLSSLTQGASGRAGAFTIAEGRDAALFLLLAPGNYTATVSAKVGTAEGAGLVELYCVR